MRTNRKFKVNYNTHKYDLRGVDVKIKCNRKVYRTINKYGSFERYVIHCKSIHPDIKVYRSRLLKRIYQPT